MVISSDHAPRVLVDRYVLDAHPALADFVPKTQGKITLKPIDLLSVLDPLGDDLRHFHPDVVVVDDAWMHLSSLLSRVLETRGIGPVHAMIATRDADSVFKVQLAHRGFLGFVDLSETAERFVDQVCDALKLTSPPSLPHLWSTVPLPAMVDKSIDTARDEIDREILDLVCVGMQDADIAAVVHASTQTVKNRISAMLERSGLRNRTQLAWMVSDQAIGVAVMRGLRRRTNENAAAIG